MELLPMQERHVAAVAALERVCFTDPWSEHSIRAELDNPLSLWFVAVEDGEVCGYVGSQTVLGESDMMNLAVAPAYRRQGLGRRLVEALCDALREKGSERLLLEVRRSNEAALALYASLGFTQIGVRPNYYYHPTEDALILRKELIP